MIRIERLKKDDLPAFHNLLLKVFDDGFSYYPIIAQRYNKNHWSIKRIDEYLNNEDFLLLTAWDKNVQVGYLIGKYFQPNKSVILWLGVIGTRRGMGVGTKLVKRWELWSKGKGAETLKASTANFENERFYESLGFKKSSRIVKNDWGMKKIVFVKEIYFDSHQKSTF
jgi:GNAT superfamily N-acetyltransferase